MKRRRSVTEPLSLSLLDVLACALGGVLLLLLLSSRQHVEQTAQAQSSLIQLQADAARQGTRARRATASLKQAGKQIAALQATIAGTQQAIERIADKNQLLASHNQSLATSNKQLQRLQQQTASRLRELELLEQALIGLKGDLQNTVFVFDTSGSMKTQHFGDYQNLLATWIESIDCQRFDVISFNRDVAAWRGSWVPGDDANRRRAGEFVSQLKPDGSTNTLAAFQFALDAGRYPNVDTIVFFSDGAPTDCSFHDVTTWLRDNHPDVVINTVGMGNYFNEAWGQFLHDIAEQHDGVFIGR